MFFDLYAGDRNHGATDIEDDRERIEVSPLREVRASLGYKFLRRAEVPFDLKMILSGERAATGHRGASDGNARSYVLYGGSAR